MKQQTILILTLSLVLSMLSSCKDDKDTIAPEINIDRPLESAQFSALDSIPFRVEVSDDHAIKSVRLMLLDPDQVPVLTTLKAVPNSNPFIFEGKFPLDNVNLVSGKYTLQFQAFDGTNTTNEFQEIYISEIPREFQYLVVTYKPDAFTVNIDKMNSQNLFVNLYHLQSGYSCSEVNSQNQQVYLAGVSTQPFVAYNLNWSNLVWHVNGSQSPSGKWFYAVKFLDPYIYLSNYDGVLRGYNASGTVQFSTAPMESYVSNAFAATPKYIVANYNSFVGGQKSRLCSLFKQSGSLWIMQLHELNIIDLFPISGEKLLVVANEGNKGVIYSYDAETGKLQLLANASNTTFYDASQQDAENYAISGTNSLFWFRMSGRFLTEFGTGIANAKVCCDQTGLDLYAASGNKISRYNLKTGAFLDQYQISYPIEDIHLVYNK